MPEPTNTEICPFCYCLAKPKKTVAVPCVKLTVSVPSVPLYTVKNMNVFDETSVSMRVNWDGVVGATGYMLLYNSVNASEPQLEFEVHEHCKLYLWSQSQQCEKVNLIMFPQCHKFTTTQGSSHIDRYKSDTSLYLRVEDFHIYLILAGFCLHHLTTSRCGYNEEVDLCSPAQARPTKSPKTRWVMGRISSWPEVIEMI